MILDMFRSGPRYTEDELMARLKFFIGICLALTLFGIVFVVLYSLVFVTQPLNAIAPIDQKFFELIIPIATFLTGTLSGIMLAGSKPEDQKAMIEAQKMANENFEATKKAMTAPPAPAPSSVKSQSTKIEPGLYVSQETINDVSETVKEVVSGFGGKPAPKQPPHPEI